MKRKDIVQLFFLSIFIVGCGGFEGDTTLGVGDSLLIRNINTQSIVINCDGTNQNIATNDCADSTNNFTCIEPKNRLVSDNSATQLRIIDNSANKTKKVCVMNGSAHIIK